jgi:hypothetical protein
MRSRPLLVVALVALGLPVAAVAAPSVGAGMSPVVSTALAGKNEVPKGAAGGSGLVVLHLDGAKHSVCWAFSNVVKIGKPLAAHIHRGTAGRNGPVIVPLGAAFKSKGCAMSTAAVIGAIEEHPSRYYVNVHTAMYKNGAIRGQLTPGMHG